MSLKYNVEIPKTKTNPYPSINQEQILEFYESGNKTAEILDFTNAKAKYSSLRSATHKLNLPVRVIFRENRVFLKREDME